MKTSLIIVGSDLNAPGSQSLKRAASDLGIDAEIALGTAPDTLQKIQEASHVVFRLRPDTYGVFMELKNALSGPHATLLGSMLAAFDKHATYERLVANNIATPASKVLNSQDTIDEYPVVAKILNGNQGIGVALLRSADDLRELKATFPNERTFLLQEYIEESKGTDMRLFVVGDRVVASMRRVAGTDDFRANLHLGARMEKYIPTAEEIELAVRATKAFGLSFAGVDIITSNRGPLVLEVNPSPGFGIQEVSDTDIAREVIKGVMND